MATKRLTPVQRRALLAAQEGRLRRSNRIGDLYRTYIASEDAGTIASRTMDVLWERDLVHLPINLSAGVYDVYALTDKGHAALADQQH